MTTATHWNDRPDLGDSFNEGWPMEDPAAAARDFLGQYESDWQAWDLMCAMLAKKPAHVTLHGMVNDPHGPTQDEMEHDLASAFWKPGDIWYRPTGDTRTVEVSLSFKLVEAT